MLDMIRRGRRLTPMLVAIVVGHQALLGTPVAHAVTPAKPYDFNGDGYADLAIGVPGDTAGGKVGAGAVNVLYGSKRGLTAAGSQRWSQESRGVKGKPTTYESFGEVVASGDFDCDGRADLAIANNTKVAVLYGSRRGLTARDQLISLPLDVSDYLPAAVQALAGGDFNRDGCSELAVARNGQLAVVTGTRGGLRQPRRLSIPATVAAPGSYTTGQGLVTGDLTGDGIADLAAGGAVQSTPAGTTEGVLVIPGSTAGLQPAVTRRYPAPPSPVAKAPVFFSRSYGASLAIGDFDGDRDPDLAIGDPRAGLETGIGDEGDPLDCPGFDFCSGAIVLQTGTRSGLSARPSRVLTNASLGRPQQSGLGRTLAAGDVNGDRRDDLAAHEYWDVVVFTGTASGLSRTAGPRWSWDSRGVKGRSSRDQFDGAFGCGVLRLLDHGRGAAADLSVGSQHYAGSEGAVNVLYGGARGISATGDQLWRQSSRGVPGAASFAEYFGGDDTCYFDED